jgi:hypothetical protein
MRRLAVIMSVLLLFGAGLVSVGSAVLAQDDTEGHPLVGAWSVDSEADNPDNPDEVVFFHGDGTLINVAPSEDGQGQEVILGVWRSSGERTADVTFRFTETGEEGETVTFTIRSSLEVAEDSNSFTGQYTLELSGIPGVEGEYGPETVTGTRLAVEPMGSPVAPVSELFGLFAEGTPEATPSA